MLKKLLYIISIITIALFISGCDQKGGENSSEPHKVHYDRDMCDRCKMVLSDRPYVAQVINPQNGRAYKFDDIGCAVLWLEEEKIPWKDSAKIWVPDLHSLKYIDARKAYYDTNNITPMAYGFAAHETKDDIKKDEEIVNFEEMTKRVFKIEEKNLNR